MQRSPDSYEMRQRKWRAEQKTRRREEERIYGEKIDPIEKDPKYAGIFREVEAILDKMFKNVVRQMGHCHLYWAKNKRC